MNASIEHSVLARRLRQALRGDVLFDDFTRGRYATDASVYQVMPAGVAVPRDAEDVAAALAIAAEEGVPLLARGGGTSQCGQTVCEGLVLDTSKHCNRVFELDVDARRIRVEPGIVLDDLNRLLKPHRLFFPIDPSTASRATIGGMAGNNSCGSRSIRYGLMADNVRAIDALMPDGEALRFAEVPADLSILDAPARYRELVAALRALAAREADEIEARLPKLLRRVGGYNIDTLKPEGHNMARMLVGSEGTLALFTAIELDLQPIPRHKVLGVCLFPTFYQAMDTTQHIVELEPAAVETVDRTLIELSREIPVFRATIDSVVTGDPDALLFVEFAGDDHAEQVARLKQLETLMADRGFPDSVVSITDAQHMAAVWEMRKAGLNIMMSMKGDAKPVSFIEDCAVGLEHLAEYTDRLKGIFTKHGTRGTFDAHASVGCLHVRPVLNVKDPDGVRKMREIAEETFAMVKEYEGSHSGEHGDGIVRSEFHEFMFGSRIVRALEEVKDRFDPKGVLNPGRIVRAPRMDDRRLFRYKPDYAPQDLATALDWSEWGGFASAIEMCNNNGACRKAAPGAMCPSFRVTHDEQHVTRGRANSLRLALTGQLGRDALGSQAMYEAMELCVSCKACKRECPTGVDMARMKIEFLHHYRKSHALRLKDRLVAYLPRYAPWAARLAPLANAADRVPAVGTAIKRMLGLAPQRPLPRWRRDAFRDTEAGAGGQSREVVLLVDTFNRYHEPDNVRAALAVLGAAGCRVEIARAEDGGRPLCCGRTFLATGLVEEARAEARRTAAALLPYARRGVPILGLEPSCLFSLRDEFTVLLPGEDSAELARHAMLLEEFLAQETKAGRLSLPLSATRWRRALLHGHCHQKAFAAMGAVESVLRLVPELEVETVESSCCGMAGAFGFEARHYGVSIAMAEQALLPAVRAADADTVLVADGTSCRQQIEHGAQRGAVHVARVLQEALATNG